MAIKYTSLGNGGKVAAAAVHGAGMVKTTGSDRFRARLGRLTGQEAVLKLGQALKAGGDAVGVEAQISITKGGRSGRIYTHEFVTIGGRPVPIRERSKPHQASAPGEVPANDTQFLSDNIEVTQPEPLLVQVASEASYSAFLEFGTSRMQPRPFMRPALLKKRFEAAKLIVQAVNYLSRKQG